MSSRWIRLTAVLFFLVGVLAWGLVRLGTVREVSDVLALVVEASEVSELSVSVPELEEAADMDDMMTVPRLKQYHYMENG